MRSNQKGFTLIELMIVVAIIGILAAVALPSYQDYIVRAKLSEGMLGASSVKVAIVDGFESDGMAGVTAAAVEINVSNTASKYVTSITVPNAATGEILVTFVAATTGLPAGANNLLYLTPGVNTGAGLAVPLADGLSGAVDWGCSGFGQVKASLTVTAPTQGSVPIRFAPSECR